MPNSDCPLCHRGYSQLSQHLGVSHGVRNKAERKLLLAIPSGRVDVRKGTCPLPAWGKYTSRMDRHLATHTEIMVAARWQATETLKRKKILEGLAQLRASNPAVAMVSTLDLAGDLEDPIVADAAAEEAAAGEQESACNNPSCQDEREDMLSESLRKVTRRYRLLLRRSRGKPSSQLTRVTGRLLSSLRLLAPGEAKEEEDQPLALPLEEVDRQDPGPEAPTPQPPAKASTSSSPGEEKHPFPDHSAALNVLFEEYRGHQEGVDPGPRLVNNVASKIRHFIGYMAAGQTDLASLGFLNQTARMRSWHNSLNQAKIAEPTVHHYLKNVAQFLAYLAEIPPPSCRLSRTVMVGLNREIKMMIRSVRRKVVMHEVRVKQAKKGRIIPKATLRQCVASAKTTIPDILAHLRETADRALQWSFYGHLTTYLACIYGHRGGVFQNMTIAEMEAAKTGSKEGCFVINAKNSHTPGDRQKVAQFMCHDISTADRFYALNLDAKQVAEHCRLFEAAVEGEDAAPGSPKAWKKTGKRAGKSSGKWPAPARLLQPIASWQPEPTTPSKRRKVGTPRKRGFPRAHLSPLKRMMLMKVAKRARKQTVFF